MPPVSTIGHAHVCPAYEGKTPHVGGPVASGQSICTISGVPAAILGDVCACEVGGPDPIVSGASLMTVNGIPVAFQGSGTAHGGAVVAGNGLLTTL